MSRRLILGAMALGTLGAALVLFSPDSDAAIAASDPVYYGIWTESFGRASISAHHALFHAVVLGITGLIRPLAGQMGAPIALRIVSATAAALVVVLVFRGAGRDRWYVGAGFALLLLGTRSFVFEAGVGESIVPGAAAALFVIDQATRPPFRPLRVWGSLVLALLVRQDNILIVPGLVLGLWHVLQPERRLQRLASGLLASAAVTVAGYVMLWLVASGGRRPFVEFMLALALDPQYADPNLIGNLRWRLDALGVAVAGRTWPSWSPNLWIGPAFLAATSIAALLLRGNARMRPLATTIAAVVLARAVFYTWFDFKNWEWSVLTLIMFAYLGSRMAEGAAVRRRFARASGAFALAGLTIVVLIGHAASTLSLREPTLMGALRHSVAAGEGCRFVAVGHSADLGLFYLGVDHVLVPSLDTGDLVESVTREVRSKPGPAVVVMDRWVYNGDPWLMKQGEIRIFLDRMESTPELRILRWQGRAYGVRYDPPELK